MVVARNWNTDWLWENTQRKYPLMDNVSATTSGGEFVIPDTFLLDMCLPVDMDPDGSPAGYYISQIASYTGGYVVTISHNDDAIGVFTVSSASHTWGTAYLIFEVSSGAALLDSEQVEKGSVAIGDLDEIDLQPAGVWSFTEDEARIQPRCIIPAVPGLPGIRVKSSGVLSELMRDVIILEPGSNVRIRTDLDTNTIWLDAVGDEDFMAACVCEGSRGQGECIRTINGVGPNQNGDFTVQPGQSCLEISAITNGLLLSDSCSSPCCGCQELDIVNSALQVLRDQFATLNAFAERLETTAEQLQTVVTASPLYPG